MKTDVERGLDDQLRSLSVDNHFAIATNRKANDEIDGEFTVVDQRYGCTPDISPRGQGQCMVKILSWAYPTNPCSIVLMGR